MKKIAIASFIAFIMLFAAPLWSFAENGAGSGEQVQVEIAVGKSEALVNGELLSVKAPVIVDNSTLVPLRVITTAFSAEMQWIAETQGIVLTYGDKTVELRIGQQTATVNGETKPIPGAPHLIEDTTMVPVRFISETFGADVQFDDVTQAIRIQGETKSVNKSGGKGSSIDADQGKTKIGDSHWGWTMNYPTGLVQQSQALNGDWIYFEDANGEYSLEISVDKSTPWIKESGLLNNLSEYSYGSTILDKRLVKRDDGSAYAKMVSKTYSDSYLEERAYLKDGVIYYYTFEIYEEENYKNQNKSAAYQNLMDSFVLSFDTNDSTVKDVSPVKDGMMQYKDNTYGIELMLPPDWTMSNNPTGLQFESYGDQNIQLYFSISTLEKGDTLETWAGRHEDRFKQELLPEYRETAKLPDQTIDGAKALIFLWSEAMGEEWGDTYDVFIVKGGFKYNFSFIYDKKYREEYRKLIEQIVASIKIDESVAEEMFGYLEDEYGVDLWETEKIVNKTYGYSVTIPTFWEEGYLNDENNISYEHRGGTFEISVETEMTFDEAVEMMEGYTTFLKELDLLNKVVENRTVLFKGVPAKKMVQETTEYAGTTVLQTIYVLEKNDHVFVIAIAENTSGRTPENIERLEKVLDSLTFE